jgi:hypothetical protein
VVVEAGGVDRGGQRLGLEPGPAALRAGHLPHVRLDLLPAPVALGVAVAAGEVGDDPFVGGRVRAGAPVAVAVLDGDLLVPQAVQQGLALRRLELRPGRAQGGPHARGHRLHHPLEVGRPGVGPRGDGPLRQRQVRVGHDQLRVDLEAGAQAVAVGACPVGGVEGEVPGGQLVERGPVVGAGQVLAEGEDLALAAVLLPGDELHLGHALGQAERRLQRVGEAAPDPLPAHQPVDHHLDGVLLVALEVDVLGQLPQLPVDPGPGVALGRQLAEQVLVLALAAPHHRRQDLEPRPLRQLEDPVDDLLRRLPRHHGPAPRAVGHADPGVQEAEVVVDLGDGPHRRAGVAGRRLLVDRDGRGQPLDEVDVGLVHLPEELPGVRRQGLDVSALALGVDGVEGEARLPRARQPGEDDQAVAGQLEGDGLEVVLPRASDEDPVRHSRASLPGPPPGEHVF